MFKRLRLPGLACLRVLFCVPALILAMTGPALAVNYTVDPGKPVSATNFHSLEDLRAAVTAWDNGDSITLAADDASLTEEFNFGAANVIVNGEDSRITPQTAGQHRFAISYGDITISGISLSGFEDLGNNPLNPPDNGKGGAIFSNTKLTLAGGVNSFADNHAFLGGGALHGESEINFNGGINTFINNSARNSGGGGAVWGQGDVNIRNGVNTFIGNSGPQAGALYASALNISGGTNTFAGNQAPTLGGAVWGANTYITGGTNVFTGNAVTDGLGGGALWSNITEITGGTNVFLNNIATGAGAKGGAIYNNGDVILRATDGDMVFSGNKAGASGSETANALFMESSMSGNTLDLGASAGRTVFFYDPIASNSANPLTIAVNNGSTYTGTVVFDGSRYPGANPADITSRASAIYGNTTVYNGTLALKNGVIYGVPGIGAFTLNSGAGLSSAGRNSQALAGRINVLNGGGINLASGSILNFDLSGMNANESALLTIAATALTDSGANVDIEAFNGSGVFNLAGSTTGGFAAAATKTLTTRGELIANTRAAGSNLGGGGILLTLTAGAGAANGVVYWLPGGREDNVWNASSKNWNTDDAGLGLSGKFLHGDAANFDGASSGGGTVQIQDGRETSPGSGVYQGRGVQIMARQDPVGAPHAAMFVSGGEWTFSGGAIESADGQIMELRNGAVVAFDNETVNNVSTGSRTMHQHVRVPSGETAALKAVDGATLNFTGMQALAAAPESGNGGAIYVGNGSTFTLGAAGSTGSIVFTGNSSGNLGGAIANFGNTTISGGINTFTANTASNSGGAIFASGVTLSGGTNTFTANTANTGGAISSATTISGGNNIFTANSAGPGGGGAISGATITISGGDNTFTANSADGGDGGALNVATITISGGTNSFIGNTAGGNGGAIYATESASLIANGGDITFRGNADSGGSQPNALYMPNTDNDNTLTLAARDGDSILFYDPIASNSNPANTNLTININQTGADDPGVSTQAHTGTVLFDHYESEVYGNTTLWNGTMKLTGGAWYGANNATGSFTVKRIDDGAGAGLLADAGGSANRIMAQTITFEDGAKISADLTRAVPLAQAGATINLVLDGDITIPASSKLIVDALNAGALNGAYKLIDNPQKFAFSETNVTGLFDGQAQWVKPNPRYGDAKYYFDPGQVDISVIGADDPRTATWTNDTGDGVWDLTSRNWDLSGNPDSSLQGWYKDGDNVLFNGQGQGYVYVDSSGAAPNSMTVSGGSYLFTGGPINGASLSLTGGETLVANHFNFSEAMTVGKGATLAVTAKGDLSPASVGPKSAFTLQNGGKLLLEPMDTAHVLRSGKITFEQGSLVGLTHFGFGPALEAGKRTVLTLEAPQISNQSGLTATSGEFIVGVYRYKYKNLAWDGDNLVMEVYGSGPGPDPEPEPDPVLSGVSPLTGSSHIAAHNPVFTMLNNRITGIFHELATMSGGPEPDLDELENTQEVSAADINNTAPGAGEVAYRNADQPNRFWFTPYYAYTDQSSGGGNVGYDLNAPALALGFERLINDSAFLGLAVSVSWPEYDGGGTTIDATDFTLAAYGGGILPWGNLEIDAHVGYGWTDYDQTRRVEGQRYDSDYDGEMFFAGAGLGRTFWLNQTCTGVWLRPGASYDYIHISTDSFDEDAGELAIRMDDYDMDIHRVKAGLEAGYEFDSGVWVLGEAYYLGVYGDREAESTGHFVGDPVNGFDVVGNGLDENNLGLGAKIGLPVGKNWELNVGYDYLVGEDAMTHQGSANITFRF